MANVIAMMMIVLGAFGPVKHAHQTNVDTNAGELNMKTINI